MKCHKALSYIKAIVLICIKILIHLEVLYITFIANHIKEVDNLDYESEIFYIYERYSDIEKWCRENE